MSSYEIGYGKPPKHTQWKPGESGNPTGRKRRKPSELEVLQERMKAIQLKEAYLPIAVMEKGKKVKMPIIQAIIRGQGVAAARGGVRAARYYMESLRGIEQDGADAYAAFVKQAIEYKRDVGAEFELRRRADPDAPTPVPHPDDIIVNTETGSVEIRGPMTEEEEVWWDRIEGLEGDIAETQEMLWKDPKNEFYKKDLRNLRNDRALLAQKVPKYRPRPSRRRSAQESFTKLLESMRKNTDKS